MAGLRALEAQGRFLVPEAMREAAVDYRAQTDTVVGFADADLHFESDARERSSAVYEAYKRRCGENTRSPLGASRFKKHLCEVYTGRVEYRHK